MFEPAMWRAVRLRPVWPLWRSWCRLVKRVENRNHPYRMRYDDYDDSHWGPISERFCSIADWLTLGDAHD